MSLLFSYCANRFYYSFFSATNNNGPNSNIISLSSSPYNGVILEPNRNTYCQRRRIRKEVNTLTSYEKDKLRTALLMAIRNSHQGKKFEDIANFHGAPYNICNNPGCCPHGDPKFLTWHRLLMGKKIFITINITRILKRFKFESRCNCMWLNYYEMCSRMKNISFCLFEFEIGKHISSKSTRWCLAWSKMYQMKKWTQLWKTIF